MFDFLLDKHMFGEVRSYAQAEHLFAHYMAEQLTAGIKRLISGAENAAGRSGMERINSYEYRNAAKRVTGASSDDPYIRVVRSGRNRSAHQNDVRADGTHRRTRAGRPHRSAAGLTVLAAIACALILSVVFAGRILGAELRRESVSAEAVTDLCETKAASYHSILIRKGDTLRSIAERLIREAEFGDGEQAASVVMPNDAAVRSLMNEIARINAIDPGSIHAGCSLIVPEVHS